jgi:serine/threonine protein kinase
MASVLAAAHEIGIVHRDLKPDNLMLIVDPDVEGGERIRVLDFGIARICMPEHLGEELDLLHMTKTGMLIGTPMYMAPEQCSSAKTVDGKADVYAIGVILYELACGQPPFIGQPQEASKPSNPGAAAVAILFSHLNHEPPPLHEKNPQLNPALASLIHRLLAKNPANRPSMRELFAELQRLSVQNTQVKFSKEATHSRPTPEDGIESRPMLATTRWRWNSAGVALVALGIVSIALYMRAERHRADVSNTTSSTSPRILPTIEAQPSDSHVPERQESILVQRSAADRPVVNSHRQSQSSSTRSGKKAKVQDASTDLPPSEEKIKSILSQAREHVSQGQFAIALETTLPIVSSKYQLPAESARLLWRQHGSSACKAGDLGEAKSAYAHLADKTDREGILYICSRKDLQCVSGDSSEFCTSLKAYYQSAQTTPASHRDLRYPF